MSTKTLGWLVGARDGKKLGSGWDPVNYIPTGPVPNFCHYRPWNVDILLDDWFPD